MQRNAQRHYDYTAPNFEMHARFASVRLVQGNIVATFIDNSKSLGRAARSRKKTGGKMAHSCLPKQNWLTVALGVWDSGCGRLVVVCSQFGGVNSLRRVAIAGPTVYRAVVSCLPTSCNWEAGGYSGSLIGWNNLSGLNRSTILIFDAECRGKCL